MWPAFRVLPGPRGAQDRWRLRRVGPATGPPSSGSAARLACLWVCVQKDSVASAECPRRAVTS